MTRPVIHFAVITQEEPVGNEQAFDEQLVGVFASQNEAENAAFYHVGYKTSVWVQSWAGNSMLNEWCVEKARSYTREEMAKYQARYA